MRSTNFPVWPYRKVGKIGGGNYIGGDLCGGIYVRGGGNL